MKELSARTANFTDSVIRRMTRISNKYGAINLSQGFPDFDPPKAISDRLAENSAAQTPAELQRKISSVHGHTHRQQHVSVPDPITYSYKIPAAHRMLLFCAFGRS